MANISGNFEKSVQQISGIGLSKDGAALVVDNREVQALCHFCHTSEAFAIPSLGALNTTMVYNKPNKWALIFGGNMRSPKRFYICDGCAKGICGK